MARTDALDMLNSADGAAKLKEAYGSLIQNIQKRALSTQLKGRNFVGDATAGSVEYQRLENTASQAYGTARAAGNGQAVVADPVVVNLDTDKEIISEIENKDARLGTVANLVSVKTAQNEGSITRELDNAFFSAVEAVSGAEVTLTATEDDLEGSFEEFVQGMETLSNDFVNGVDRELMSVTLKPAVYGALRTKFDTIIGQGGEEFVAYHGVKVFSNTRQTKDMILVVEGSVAQPAVINKYQPNRIDLSDAAAICLFFYYGTKVVAEDLVAWADLTAAV